MVSMSNRISSTSCVGVEGAADETDATESTEDIECDLDGGRCNCVVTETVETSTAGGASVALSVIS